MRSVIAPWFKPGRLVRPIIAHAPDNLPYIAMVVLVEHNDHEGNTAGPVDRAGSDTHLNTVTTPEVNP
jgi:hypothetical protein